jgi:hypothetical protein
VHMVLLSLLLSAVAVPVATALCFGFAALVRRFGYRSPDERVTTKDERWLSRQAHNFHM